MTTTREPAEEFELLEPLDDRPGPARRISSLRAAEMVRAALDGAVEVRTTARRSREPRRLRRVVLVAAALLVVAGGASAAIYQLAIRERSPEPPASSPATTARTQPSQQPEPTVEPVVVPEPEAAPEPSEPTPRARPERKRDPDRPAVAESPEDLLARANARRKDRAWREAAALYQRVRTEHAGTSAAYVATLASASIHLEHLGNARKALSLYRAAMRDRPDGYLAEEARYGIAEAHRSLGQEQNEARALGEFLDRHPGSPLRERAEHRLEELGREPGTATDQGAPRP